MTPWFPFWPMTAVAAAVAVSVVVWLWLVPGRHVDGLWGGAAAVLIITEAVWEYFELPAGAVAFQVIGWVPVVAVAAWGAGSPGWRTGLRMGLASAAAASVGLAVVFLIWLGQPVQATVLEFSGALDRFRDSSSLEFVAWSVGDHWNALPLRLAVGAGVGAGAGWAGEWLRKRARARS